METLSSETRLDQIRYLLKACGRVQVVQLKAALECCPHVVEAINDRDMTGYSLLQYAVIANRADLVEYLITQGAELNPPTCGRPLHLAAKLGHRAMIKVLLDLGADADVHSCVCYPEKHRSGKTVFNTKHWHFSCVGDSLYSKIHSPDVVFEYPLYYAIHADSLCCVQELMDNDATRLGSRRSLLQTSCKLGALKCAKMFLLWNPSSASSPNPISGLYAVQNAVRWSKDLVEQLVLSGASVNVRNTNQQSLLSIVCQDGCQGDMYQMIEYLLQCGLDKQVNSVDTSSKSPLHYLMQRASLKLPEDDKPNVETAAVFHLAEKGSEGFSKLEEQYFKSIKLLIGAGASHSLPDQTGLSPIDILLGANHQNKPDTDQLAALAAEASAKNTAHVTYNYKLLYNILAFVLGRLSDHVKFRSSVLAQFSAAGCVSLLNEAACRSNGRLLYFTKALKLLCQKSTGSQWDPPKACVIHCILNCVDAKWIDSVEEVEKVELISHFQSVVLEVLSAVLEGGYPVNACTTSRMYTETDFDALLRCSYTLGRYDLYVEGLLLLLHHGGEPVCERPRGQCLLYTTGRYDIKPLRDTVKLLHHCKAEDDKAQLRIAFSILYHATEEAAARGVIADMRLLGTTQCVLCEDLLKECLSNVKTLRQCSASVLFIRMCHRRKTEVERLLAPAVLKTYLLSLQY